MKKARTIITALLFAILAAVLGNGATAITCRHTGNTYITTALNAAQTARTDGGCCKTDHAGLHADGCMTTQTVTLSPTTAAHPLLQGRPAAPHPLKLFAGADNINFLLSF